MAQKILIIEDDTITAQLLALALRRKGYEVLQAENGPDGLQVTQDQIPDLILLDLMLPGMDGFEFLNQLRQMKNTASIPVVVVSAKSQPTDRERASDLGIKGYLTKPYRMQQLIDLVKEILSDVGSTRSETSEI